MPTSKSLTLAIGACLTVAAGSLLAQSTKTITFSNAPELGAIEIKGSLQIGDGGNLEATCAVEDGACGIDTGPSGDAPLIGLSRSPAGSVATNAQVTVSWTLLGNTTANVCITSATLNNVSTNTVVGWTGQPVSGLGGNALVSFPAPGNYALSLVCYNQFGISNIATEAGIEVTGPVVAPTGVPACDFSKLGISASSEEAKKVQPAGFTGYMKSWGDLMITSTDYPTVAGSGARPIGSFTLRSNNNRSADLPMTARFISTEINIPETLFKVLTWETMQVQNAVGYTISGRHADSMFVSISPCAGDLRPYDISSTDPWIKRCRYAGAGSSMSYGTGAGASLCKLNPGGKYYLNFAIVDTTQTPISTTSNTCATVGPSANSGGRCEAQFTH